MLGYPLVRGFDSKGVWGLAGISFSEHPRSVGETYGQHLLTAWSFAGSMIYGGLACLVHGLLPFMSTTTGSSIIRRLHDQMIIHRGRQPSDIVGSRAPSAPIDQSIAAE
jgi:hypothetical protein